MPERLTEKHIVDNIDCGYKVKKDTCENGIIQGWNKTDAINKLGKLEDVEEELGIDLITLFKALKNGVYSNHYAYAGEEIHKIDVELQKRHYGFCVSGGFGEGHNLKDYGKTWALTKEELL